jgi:ribonuclease-3
MDDAGASPSVAPTEPIQKINSRRRHLPPNPDASLYPATIDTPPRSMAELENRIGYQFRNRRLLLEALMHSSAAANFDPPATNNQRLEFLGDAVLELVMSSFLFSNFPSANEGDLTKSRAHLVNREALYRRAIRLGLGQFLILSKSENQNNGRNKVTALVDTFEALIGAIHVDGGYHSAEEFISMIYADELEDTENIPVQVNPKGELQEFVQKLDPSHAVQYETIHIDNPDHDRIFECNLFYVGRHLATGRGRSKKIAETQAAERAIIFLQEEMDAGIDPRLNQAEENIFAFPSPEEMQEMEPSDSSIDESFQSIDVEENRDLH